LEEFVLAQKNIPRAATLDAAQLRATQILLSLLTARVCPVGIIIDTHRAEKEVFPEDPFKSLAQFRMIASTIDRLPQSQQPRLGGGLMRACRLPLPSHAEISARCNALFFSRRGRAQ
jgi:hypothetical protein